MKGRGVMVRMRVWYCGQAGLGLGRLESGYIPSFIPRIEREGSPRNL